jgi:hypothetical protein
MDEAGGSPLPAAMFEQRTEFGQGGSVWAALPPEGHLDGDKPQQ